jgi:soluble lytic murein transglycosylase-like protein
LLKRTRFFIVLLSSALGFAADPAGQGHAKKVSEGSVARQAESARAMRESIASQRLSVREQLARSSSKSFFALPIPAPIMAPPRTSWGSNCGPESGPEIDSVIEGAARRENLQLEVIRGIVDQESAFRPCAVSPKGAMGLMQLMPGTAAQLGVKNPFDPKENVYAGARFFKQLLDLYGNLPMALGAYNAGPSRVDEAGGIPSIPETLRYVQKILSGLPSAAR